MSMMEKQKRLVLAYLQETEALEELRWGHIRSTPIRDGGKPEPLITCEEFRARPRYIRVRVNSAICEHCSQKVTKRLGTTAAVVSVPGEGIFKCPHCGRASKVYLDAHGVAR